jgi:hypothetical protein
MCGYLGITGWLLIKSVMQTVRQYTRFLQTALWVPLPYRATSTSFFRAALSPPCPFQPPPLERRGFGGGVIDVDMALVTIQLILVKKSNMVYTKGKVVGNEALPGVEYPVFVCPCLGSTTTRNSQRVATQTTVRGSAPRARLKNTGVSNEGNVHFTLYPVSQHERNQRGFRPEKEKVNG